MLGKKIGRSWKALTSRKRIAVKSVREDFRKLGLVLVLVGSGLLAVMLKGELVGIIPALFGFFFLYIGLTRPRRRKNSSRAKKEG